MVKCMRPKLSLRCIPLYYLIAIVVFVSCWDSIAYFNRILHITRYFYILRYLLIFFLFGFNFIKKKKYTVVFKITTLFLLIMLGSTQIHGYDLNYAIQFTSSFYLMILFLESYKKHWLEIIEIWNILLWILVILDLFSMFIFPNGLYSDGRYSLNWILGYKTARLVFSLPLCVFTAIGDISRSGRLRTKSFLAVILSCIAGIKAQATGATLALVMLGVLFLLVNFSYKKKALWGIIRKIINYKVIVPIYILVVIATIMIERIPMMQQLVNMLGKDATLTTRTFIWSACLKQIVQSPLWGYGYLTEADFIEITGNYFAGSAHNMVLSILMAVGIIGLILYSIIIILSIRKIYFGEESMIQVIIISGIIVQLFIGISSSSLVFCMFGFVFFEIIAIIKTMNYTVNFGNNIDCGIY